MRRLLVEPNVVDMMFPGVPKEEQRKLMVKRIKFHVEYDEEDDCFIIHTPKLVRFNFEVELLANSLRDVDVKRWERKGIPLAPSVCTI